MLTTASETLNLCSATARTFKLGLLLGLHLVRASLLALTCVFGRKGSFQSGYPQLLARLAEQMGPAALKLAQIASSRPDLLPGWLTDPLTRLQSSVAPPTSREVTARLASLWPEGYNRVFSDITLVPIGSGSIAYVLEACTREDEPVVLKVVRPGVRQQMAYDMALLKVACRLVEKTRLFSAVPLGEVLQDFCSLCLSQCSMLKEAENLQLLSQQLSTDVIIPRVLPNLSNDDVLVLSRVDTRWPLTCSSLPRDIYRKLSLVLLREVFCMVFVHGLVHGDLHPGNVRVSFDGRLVLVDFGLLARLSELDRRHFRSLFFGVATNDPRLVALSIIDSSTCRPPNIDMAALEVEVQHLLRRRSRQRAGDFLVAEFTSELFEIQRSFRLTGTPGFAAAIWALAMFEGLIRRHYPDLDFQKEALRVLMTPYRNRDVLVRK